MDFEKAARFLARELKKHYYRCRVYEVVLGRIKTAGFPGVNELIEEAFGDQELRKSTDRSLSFLGELRPTAPEVDIPKIQSQPLDGWEPGKGRPQ